MVWIKPDHHHLVFGDNPQKTNERQDVLDTPLHSYRPQISAIMQSENLYVYSLNNPVTYSDITGQLAAEASIIIMAAAAITVILWNGAVYISQQTGELLTDAMNSREARKLQEEIAAAVSGIAVAASGAPDPDDDN